MRIGIEEHEIWLRHDAVDAMLEQHGWEPPDFENWIQVPMCAPRRQSPDGEWFCLYSGLIRDEWQRLASHCSWCFAVYALEGSVEACSIAPPPKPKQEFKLPNIPHIDRIMKL